VRRIRFSKISTLDELLGWKSRFGADGFAIAGGTDLIVWLREQSSTLPPLDVADITGVRELMGIAVEEENAGGTGGMVRIGPLATHAEISASSIIRERSALLSMGASGVGSPQIRNRGTIGGNLCNASPCADTAPPLIALGAKLTLRSMRGTREIPLEEAILGPYRTTIAQDEILTDIRFAPLAEGAGSAFIKLGRRNALSISRMSIAVSARMDPRGVLREVRVAGGSVAPTPRRFPAVEGVLEGNAPTSDILDAAGNEMVAEMIRMTGARWSTPYKAPVVASLLKRAVTRAIAPETK
jgi:CO/xanthine dehydrogenase FAD-binding subunit